MDDITVQKVWAQLEGEIFCGDCRAARILIWDRDKHGDRPQHAVVKDDVWYAVHCDYFKRRVEAPNKLARCGAHQKKDED